MSEKLEGVEDNVGEEGDERAEMGGADEEREIGGRAVGTDLGLEGLSLPLPLDCPIGSE